MVRVVAILSVITAALLGGEDWKPTRVAAPEYPCLAIMAKIHGGAEVEVTVDDSGRPSAIRAVFGHPLLVAQAIASARKWRFQRAGRTGGYRPVFVINYTFHIRDPAMKDDSPYEHTWEHEQSETIIELPNRVIVSASYDPKAKCKSLPTE